jgi:hypothetical protein
MCLRAFLLASSEVGRGLNAIGWHTVCIALDPSGGLGASSSLQKPTSSLKLSILTPDAHEKPIARWNHTELPLFAIASANSLTAVTSKRPGGSIDEGGDSTNAGFATNRKSLYLNPLAQS